MQQDQPTFKIDVRYCTVHRLPSLYGNSGGVPTVHIQYTGEEIDKMFYSLPVAKLSHNKVGI
jgi:hypothetical protein